ERKACHVSTPSADRSVMRRYRAANCSRVIKALSAKADCRHDIAPERSERTNAACGDAIVVTPWYSSCRTSGGATERGLRRVVRSPIRRRFDGEFMRHLSRV